MATYINRKALSTKERSQFYRTKKKIRERILEEKKRERYTVVQERNLIYTPSMQYYVIEFIGILGSRPIAVILDKWLITQKTCLWPGDAFATVYLKNKVDSAEGWETCNINIIKHFETLQEANRLSMDLSGVDTDSDLCVNDEGRSKRKAKKRLSNDFLQFPLIGSLLKKSKDNGDELIQKENCIQQVTPNREILSQFTELLSPTEIDRFTFDLPRTPLRERTNSKHNSNEPVPSENSDNRFSTLQNIRGRSSGPSTSREISIESEESATTSGRNKSEEQFQSENDANGFSTLKSIGRKSVSDPSTSQELNVSINEPEDTILPISDTLEGHLNKVQSELQSYMSTQFKIVNSMLNQVLNRMVQQENDSASTTAGFDAFIKALPLTTTEEFKDFNNSLKDKKKNDILVKFFTGLGGTNSSTACRNCLSRAISQELTVQMSWTGRRSGKSTGDKLRLKGTDLMDVLIVVIQQSYRTSVNEIEKTAMRWIQHTLDRCGGRKRRELQKSQTTTQGILPTEATDSE